MAIGSRGIHDRGTKVEARLYRRIAGRIFHAVVRLYAIRGFTDTQCGFKLFDSAAAHDLFSRMRMSGYSFDVEVLLMALRSGYRVDEVPVNWTHQPGSKVHVIRDGLRMAMDVMRIRANALRGLYDRPHIALPESAIVTPSRDFAYRETTSDSQVARRGSSECMTGSTDRGSGIFPAVDHQRSVTQTAIMRAGPSSSLVIATRCQPDAVSRTAAIGNDTGKIAKSAVRHGCRGNRPLYGLKYVSGRATESGKNVRPSIDSDRYGSRHGM